MVGCLGQPLAHAQVRVGNRDNAADSLDGAIVDLDGRHAGVTEVAQQCTEYCVAVGDGEDRERGDAAFFHLLGVSAIASCIGEPEVERRRSGGGFQSLPEVEGAGRMRRGEIGHPRGDSVGGDHPQLFAVYSNGETTLSAQRRDDTLEQELGERGLGDLALGELRQAHQALELCS